MLASSRFKGALDRVARVCDSHDEAGPLRLALLDELRRVLTFDAYAWPLTDPETEVASAPLADVPCLPELPRLIRLKYLTTVNRWTTLEAPVAFLRSATDGHPERSVVWRELMANYDVHDVASLVFRDRYGCWAFLDLWRREAVNFTQADLEFLTEISPPITQALRRCQARTFSYESSRSERSGPIVLLLSPGLEVKAQTPETEDYLRALLPPDADRRAIPAAAFNVASQLMAVESGVDDHAPWVRVHLAEGSWLTLRAARIGGAGPIEDQDVAVTIEPSSGAERMAVFVRACGLSDREAELVGHLANGADTRQIAREMFLSEHTIQDHLRSIFAKTGTRSRGALLARAARR